MRNVRLTVSFLLAARDVPANQVDDDIEPPLRELPDIPVSPCCGFIVSCGIQQGGGVCEYALQGILALYVNM